MSADAFVIRLPDGTLHYARSGHVNALCGANRVTTADHWTGTVDAICPTCVLIHDEPNGPTIVACPDCSTPWPIFSGEPCPGCGLSEEDVEAAADFWIALSPGPL